MTSTAVEFLSHYGVRGMKWGVRRSPRQLVTAARSRTENKTVYSEKGNRLTMDELNHRIRRLETEKRYNELNSRTVSSGERIATEILTNAGKKAATTALAGVAVYGIKKVVEAKFGKNMAEFIPRPKK